MLSLTKRSERALFSSWSFVWRAVKLAVISRICAARSPTVAMFGGRRCLELNVTVESNVSSVSVLSGDWKACCRLRGDAKGVKNPLSLADEYMGEVGAGGRSWLSVVLGVEVGLFMGGWEE